MTKSLCLSIVLMSLSCEDNAHKGMQNTLMHCSLKQAKSDQKGLEMNRAMTFKQKSDLVSFEIMLMFTLLEDDTSSEEFYTT